MIRAICAVVVIAFLANGIQGRSILIPLDSTELPSPVAEKHEHFDDELKRDKKSFLSTPFVRGLSFFLFVLIS